MSADFRFRETRSGCRRHWHCRYRTIRISGSRSKSMLSPPKVNWWLVSFTLQSWSEFKQRDPLQVGFRTNKLSAASKITPSDYMLCYLTGVSRFIGILEATSRVYMADDRWLAGAFPCRVNVRVLSELSPENGVPVSSLRGTLPLFNRLSDQRFWSGAFRSSPTHWSREDAEIVYCAIGNALKFPKPLPISEARIRQRERALAEAYDDL